jgi:rhodanese-related sulfurtransferase
MPLHCVNSAPYFRALLVLLVSSALLGCTTVHAAPTWFQVNTWIAIRYPFVNAVSTSALSEMMVRQNKSPEENAFLLLDIREPHEYAVSHLPGAIHVHPNDVVAYANRNLTTYPKTNTIVVYCAVGVRSAAAAQSLTGLGFTNVVNLTGSIFAWANEGHAIVGGALVHPFDAHWSQLLAPPYRAKLPEK